MDNQQLSADLKRKVQRFVDKHPDSTTTDGVAVPALSPFWQYYSENKAALYEHGLFVFKSRDGSWRVRYSDSTERKHENEQKIEKWLLKLSHCGCVDYFDDMIITRRTLRNGTVRYDWRCPVCKKTARNDGQDSEALPYVLISELQARGCRVVEVDV